ncbi:hypothetical protein LLH00_12195 [bacterium]|nr:hypothetical protein [bacterium]
MPYLIRATGLRHAALVETDRAAMDAIQVGIQGTLLRLIRHEQARLAVAGIRSELPEVPLVAAERAAGLITCLSQHTVHNLVSQRRTP